MSDAMGHKRGPCLQVYQPLEFLLFVAAISTVVEAVLPPLVAVQKETVRTCVRTILSLTYVIASAFVAFNVKARIVQERCWKAEIMGVLLVVSARQFLPCSSCRGHLHSRL